MIEGVKVKKLKIIEDERGFLMEILRSDDEIFEKFGQIYLTAVNPGYVKGWHYHKKQNDHFICVKGKVKVVLYDPRSKSSTKGQIQEFFLSYDNPLLVKIPRGVYHGFETDCNEISFIINIPTELYNYDNPDEHRIPFNSDEIPYKWKSEKGG